MNHRALTLIEIVIAMLILALVMLGMGNVFVTSKRFLLHNRLRMGGGQLGKFFLDPLYQQVGNSTPGCFDDNTLCNTTPQLVDSGISVTPQYRVSGVNVVGTMKKVRLDLSWTEPPSS
jgi:prepilin-type N-terminal cleavage/methylation domain-containing protein